MTYCQVKFELLVKKFELLVEKRELPVLLENSLK